MGAWPGAPLIAPAGVEEAGGVAVPFGAAGAVLERPPTEAEVVLLAPGDAVPLGAEVSAVSEDVALSLLDGVRPPDVVLVVGVWLLDLRVELPTSFLKRLVI